VVHLTLWFTLPCGSPYLAVHLTLRQSALKSKAISQGKFAAEHTGLISLKGLKTSDLVTGAAVVNSQPECSWMAPEPVYNVTNKYAKWITQTGVPGKTAIWDRGLHGEGQIVGIADSGLDHGSCFFNDAAKTVVVKTGVAGGPLFEDTTHRKIVQYRAFADDVAGETRDHGTHVAGSVGGHSVNPQESPYNGMAYEARLAFFDIGKPNQGESLYSCAVVCTVRVNSSNRGARYVQ